MRRNPVLSMTSAALALAVVCASANAFNGGTVFYENFNFGWGSWSATNGVWGIGPPTVGPPAAYEGQFCAGTNLDGNYPPNTSSTLASPWIALPQVANDERLLLKYWHWFRFARDSYYGYDRGYVDVYDAGTWKQVSTEVSGMSPTWSRSCVDLTPFAGKTIKLGFRFGSSWAQEDNGWYVDLVSVEHKTPVFRNPENCESDLGDWGADNGVWQLGDPSVGPPTCPSGSQCFGTHLSGNYWDGNFTRLISPPVTLTPKPGRLPELRFMQWFRFAKDSYYGTDSGYAQVFVNGSWTTLATYTGSSPQWSLASIDLSQYSGQTIQLGFYFVSSWAQTDNGWYIDNVEVAGVEGHREVHFEQFGQGLAGSGGVVPVLSGRDESVTGNYGVIISNGLGQAPGALLLGFAEADLFPFFGGHCYVDLSAPWIVLPVVLQGAKDDPGGGYLSFQGIDVSVYGGITLSLQACLADPGAVNGVSLTQGLRMIIPQ